MTPALTPAPMRTSGPVWASRRAMSLRMVSIPAQQEDAAPLVVDRERIKSLGLELVEAPVSCSTGNLARHSHEALADVVMDIYRERAVRIFHGKKRYIIEE